MTESKSRTSDLVRLLRPFAGPHLGTLILVVVLGSVGALLQQGTLLLLTPTVEVLFEGKPDEGSDVEATEFLERISKAVIGDVDADSDPDERLGAMARIAVVVSLMALASGIIQYLSSILGARVGLDMIVALRMALARHLMGLSLRFHTGSKFGDLLSRISNDVGKTLAAVQTMLRDLVQEPLLALAALAYAAKISPLATLIVVLGMPILIVPISILLKKVRRGSNRSLTQLGASMQVLSQMFTGVRTVKAYRAEARELDRFQRSNDDFVSASMKMFRASSLSQAWTVLYTHMGLGVMLVVVGAIVIYSETLASSGALITFFFFISRVYTSVKKTTRTLGQVAEAQGAAQRLQSLLDEQPDLVEHTGARTLDELGVAGLGEGLRVEGVTFRYEADAEPALVDVDLEVRPGETLALVGASGSGKSTLLDLVARFIDPTEGRVTVGGVDLREVSFDGWNSRWAMVTQSPFLFHASIAENLRYGRPEATQAELEEAARAANIHDFIADLPDGYETDVRDAGARLSGGQRQRITIARALLKDPELLLLDEATSALDTESEAIVQAALDRVMEGRTTIVIAHRLSTIRGADRIAVLEAGRIVEVGTHEELLAREGAYGRLHNG